MTIVPVRVHGLVVEPKSGQQVVVLREAEGERILPIWIGPGEALAIRRLIEGEAFPRPLTHDLIALIVEGLRARVARVVISDLRDNTFFAHILVERGEDEVLSIDARPSDSVAVALRTQAPIFANEELLQSPPKPGEGATDEPETPPVDDAERLRRFLEGLNPEDFGKFRP